MNYSSVNIPVDYLYLSSSAQYTTSLDVSTSNQIFDWVTVSNPQASEGEVYYFKSGSGWQLASVGSDEESEAVAIVESASPILSGSICKFVYKGKIQFSENILLDAGKVYYLSESSRSIEDNFGPNYVKNLTTTEPSASKPILIATSEHSGVVVNMRGHVYGEQSKFSFVPDLDVECPKNPVINVIFPKVFVWIGDSAPDTW